LLLNHYHLLVSVMDSHHDCRRLLLKCRILEFSLLYTTVLSLGLFLYSILHDMIEIAVSDLSSKRRKLRFYQFAPSRLFSHQKLNRIIGFQAQNKLDYNPQLSLSSKSRQARQESGVLQLSSVLWFCDELIRKFREKICESI
jgi:hypothetical protein